jgi:hypothetical protein
LAAAAAGGFWESAAGSKLSRLCGWGLAAAGGSAGAAGLSFDLSSGIFDF